MRAAKAVNTRLVNLAPAGPSISANWQNTSRSSLLCDAANTLLRVFGMRLPWHVRDAQSMREGDLCLLRCRPRRILDVAVMLSIIGTVRRCQQLASGRQPPLFLAPGLPQPRLASVFRRRGRRQQNAAAPAPSSTMRR